MRSWSQAKPEVSALRNEVVSQSRVRIVICAFMGGYYSVFDISNHPLYLAFALYSTALLLIAPKISARRNAVPILTLILDNSFAIWGLHLTGERGSFLLFFLIHFSFAYGIRYGRGYLIGSLAISCAGVTWLFLRSFPWQGHIHFLLSFLFGMPFISIYVYSLTKKLRISEASATANAHRTAQLLVFLAHDIRTPLHQLLGLIKKLQVSAFAAPCAATFNNMENLVTLMARMCSGIVAGQSTAGTGWLSSSLDAEDPQSATLNQTIVAFIELFRERIALEGAELRYELSGRIPPSVAIDFSSAERALSNIISNVARHCRDGHVAVRVRPEPYDETKVRIEIENARVSALDQSEFDSASEAGKHSIFFGASIGLESMRDVMESVGGAFIFQALDNATFLSTMVFPVSNRPSPYRIKSQLPVVMISRDFALQEKCRDMLGGAANLYCYSSIEIFNLVIDYYAGEIAAVFVEFPGDISSVGRATFDGFSDRHGLVVVLSTGTEDLERISVQQRQIRIDRESAQSTWLQALKISEDFRTTKKMPSSQGDYNVGTLSSARILALDDNLLNLSFLVAGLSNFGLSVKPINSLTAAVNELTRVNYDILILDWNIGHITAFELLQKIQDGPLANSLKIVILTAQSIELKEMQLRSVENITVLTKPIDNASILFAIRQSFLPCGFPSTKEIGTSADKIFFLDSYRDMDWSNHSIQVMDDLLGRFLADIQERIAEIAGPNTELSHEDLARRLHAITSMCYSVGAYALGDEFNNDKNRLSADFSRDSSEYDGQFGRIRDVLSLTKMHVSMFQLCVRARGNLSGEEGVSPVH